MRSQLTFRRILFVLLALVSLPAVFASCGGGGGGGGFFPPPTGGTRYAITGTVTEGTNGLEGVKITISGTGTGTITTGANGSFTISNLRPGAYTLIPTKTNSQFDPASRTVNLSANATGINFAKLIQDAQEVGGGNDTAGTATPVTYTVDFTQANTLYPDGDEDWMKITFPAAATGKTYEFSANGLSNDGDTVMELYDGPGATLLVSWSAGSSGAQLSADDYIGLDSRIKFDVPAGADVDYSIRVLTTSPFQPLQLNNGTARYTLSVHEFVDADSDNVSDYYDCDDSVTSIHPDVLLDAAVTPPVDIPNDGIDQDCTAGYDELNGATADSAESDNAIADAKPMAATGGDGWEAQFRSDIYSVNARTIHTIGDFDVFSIAIPPRSAIYVHVAESFTNTFAGEIPQTSTHIKASQILQPSGNVLQYAILDAADPSTFLMVENSDPAYSTTVYIKFEGDGTNTGYYVPFYFSVGTDMDGDNAYSQDWPGFRDCDDTNAAITPFVWDPNALGPGIGDYVPNTDTPNDNIDSNCNGHDNT